MIVVAACSLAGVGEAASQTKHLAGVVRDEAGNPVPGVSVKILDSWQYVIMSLRKINEPQRPY